SRERPVPMLGGAPQGRWPVDRTATDGTEGSAVSGVSFTVVGLPAPQGSKSKMPNGHLVEGSSTSGRAAHSNWRTAVAWAARNAAGARPPLDGPLVLGIVLRFPMPKSRPAAIRNTGIGPHTVKPDKDKVLRATLDALKDGGLI